MIRLSTRGKVILWSLVLLATAAGFAAFRLSGRAAREPDVMAPTVASAPSGAPVGLFARSLVLAAAATLIAVVIAVPTGLALGASPATWWTPLPLFPLLMPPHLSAYIWRFTLEDITRALLPGATLWAQAWTRFLGAAWTLAVLYWPLIALPVALVMRIRGNRLQDELATLAPPVATFRGAVLPGLAPVMVGGMGLVFLMSLANYGVPLMWNVPTQNVAVFARLAAYYEPGPALRLSLPLQLTVLALCVAGLAWLRGKDYGLDLIRPPQSGRAGRARWPAVWTGLTLFVTIALPTISLMVIPHVFDGIRPSFIVGLPALGWGMALALIGATSALALGAALAFLFDRRPRASVAVEMIGLCASSFRPRCCAWAS